MVRAGTGMDFYAYNERAQIFFSVQTAGRDLPIQKRKFFFIDMERNNKSAFTHGRGLGHPPNVRLVDQTLC